MLAHILSLCLSLHPNNIATAFPLAALPALSQLFADESGRTYCLILKRFAMQQIYLAMFFLGLTAINSLAAQCTPLDSIPGGAIIDPLPFTEAMPENGLRDTACVGQDFETVLHIAVPEVVNLGALGNLPIDSVSIVGPGITGLPNGFSFDCSAENCVFYPNEVSCIRIFGLADAGAVGTYSIAVNVRIHSGIFNLDRTLPDPTLAPGEYLLQVRDAAAAACQPSNVRPLAASNFSMLLSPNPSHDITTLSISAMQNSYAKISVFDTFGRVVMQQNTSLLAGENQLSLSTQHLAAGYYHVLFQELDGARELLSTKLLVLPN